MITVRYPGGFSVQYNDANYSEPQLDGSIKVMRKDEAGRLYIRAHVMASAGALIELFQPCRTYDANETDDTKLVNVLMERLRGLSGARLRQLKRALAGFDAKRERWRDART